MNILEWLLLRFKQFNCSHRNCVMDPTDKRIGGSWYCDDCGKNVGSVYGAPKDFEE